MKCIPYILASTLFLTVLIGTKKAFTDLYAQTHPTVTNSKPIYRAKITHKTDTVITRHEMSHFYAQADALFQEKQSSCALHVLHIVALNLRSKSRFLRTKKQSVSHFAAQSLILTTDCRKNCLQKGTVI